MSFPSESAPVKNKFAVNMNRQSAGGSASSLGIIRRKSPFKSKIPQRTSYLKLQTPKSVGKPSSPRFSSAKRPAKTIKSNLKTPGSLSRRSRKITFSEPLVTPSKFSNSSPRLSKPNVTPHPVKKRVSRPSNAGSLAPAVSQSNEPDEQFSSPQSTTSWAPCSRLPSIGRRTPSYKSVLGNTPRVGQSPSTRAENSVCASDLSMSSFTPARNRCSISTLADLSSLPGRKSFSLLDVSSPNINLDFSSSSQSGEGRDFGTPRARVTEPPPRFGVGLSLSEPRGKTASMKFANEKIGSTPELLRSRTFTLDEYKPSPLALPAETGYSESSNHRLSRSLDPVNRTKSNCELTPKNKKRGQLSRSSPSRVEESRLSPGDSVFNQPASNTSNSKLVSFVVLDDETPRRSRKTTNEFRPSISSAKKSFLSSPKEFSPTGRRSLSVPNTPKADSTSTKKIIRIPSFALPPVRLSRRDFSPSKSDSVSGFTANSSKNEPASPEAAKSRGNHSPPCKELLSLQNNFHDSFFDSIDVLSHRRSRGNDECEGSVTRSLSADSTAKSMERSKRDLANLSLDVPFDGLSRRSNVSVPEPSKANISLADTSSVRIKIEKSSKTNENINTNGGQSPKKKSINDSTSRKRPSEKSGLQNRSTESGLSKSCQINLSENGIEPSKMDDSSGSQVSAHTRVSLRELSGLQNQFSDSFFDSLTSLSARRNRGNAVDTARKSVPLHSPNKPEKLSKFKKASCTVTRDSFSRNCDVSVAKAPEGNSFLVERIAADTEEVISSPIHCATLSPEKCIKLDSPKRRKHSSEKYYIRNQTRRKSSPEKVSPSLNKAECRNSDKHSLPRELSNVENPFIDSISDVIGSNSRRSRLNDVNISANKSTYDPSKHNNDRTAHPATPSKYSLSSFELKNLFFETLSVKQKSDEPLQACLISSSTEGDDGQASKNSSQSNSPSKSPNLTRRNRELSALLEQNYSDSFIEGTGRLTSRKSHNESLERASPDKPTTSRSCAKSSLEVAYDSLSRRDLSISESAASLPSHLQLSSLFAERSSVRTRTGTLSNVSFNFTPSLVENRTSSHVVTSTPLVRPSGRISQNKLNLVQCRGSPGSEEFKESSQNGNSDVTNKSVRFTTARQKILGKSPHQPEQGVNATVTPPSQTPPPVVLRSSKKHAFKSVTEDAQRFDSSRMSTPKSAFAFRRKAMTEKKRLVKSGRIFKRKLDALCLEKSSKAANRLKVEPPKALDKKKMAALLVCHKKKTSPLKDLESTPVRMTASCANTTDVEEVRVAAFEERISNPKKEESSNRQKITEDDLVAALGLSRKSSLVALEAQRPARRLRSNVNKSISLSGVRQLFFNDRQADYVTHVDNLKHAFRIKQEPISDNVRGEKGNPEKTLQLSPQADYSNVSQLKRVFTTSPVVDYTDVSGVKKLFLSPSASDSGGIKELLPAGEVLITDSGERLSPKNARKRKASPSVDTFDSVVGCSLNQTKRRLRFGDQSAEEEVCSTTKTETRGRREAPQTESPKTTRRLRSGVNKAASSSREENANPVKSGKTKTDFASTSGVIQEKKSSRKLVVTKDAELVDPPTPKRTTRSKSAVKSPQGKKRAQRSPSEKAAKASKAPVKSPAKKTKSSGRAKNPVKVSPSKKTTKSSEASKNVAEASKAPAKSPAKKTKSSGRAKNPVKTSPSKKTTKSSEASKKAAKASKAPGKSSVKKTKSSGAATSSAKASSAEKTSKTSTSKTTKATNLPKKSSAKETDEPGTAEKSVNSLPPRNTKSSAASRQVAKASKSPAKEKKTKITSSPTKKKSKPSDAAMKVNKASPMKKAKASPSKKPVKSSASAKKTGRPVTKSASPSQTTSKAFSEGKNLSKTPRAKKSDESLTPKLTKKSASTSSILIAPAKASAEQARNPQKGGKAKSKRKPSLVVSLKTKKTVQFRKTLEEVHEMSIRRLRQRVRTPNYRL